MLNKRDGKDGRYGCFQYPNATQAAAGSEYRALGSGGLMLLAAQAVVDWAASATVPLAIPDLAG